MRNLIPVILLSAVILGFSPQLKAQKEGKPAKKDVLITMTTAYGDMNIILFDETPKHKANFIKLAEEGFYDQTLFHRVMLGFMIQGGDPNTKPGGNRKAAGQGGPGYTIPAEFVKGIKHEKGSLTATGFLLRIDAIILTSRS
ncbi:MAG: peptidylprolyl isomerase [Bacteroidota bacterium]